MLDTWFSSGLLPCSALGWPDSTPDLDAFYPTTLLITGFDILFFWVARMIMMNCHFMRGHKHGDVPFRNVYIHALVRDAERQKMSKTKGNVMDPIEIIEQYGTDAVRFTLASMAAPGTDIAFSESRTESYRAFANKIWNAARFLFMNVDRAQEAGLWSLAEFGVPRFIATDFAAKGVSGFKAETLDDRWILSRFNRVAQQMHEALETYRFHEAAHVVYHFFWGEYCDWYLELIKPRLAGRRPRAGAHCLREPDQHLRRRAAHVVAVHAVHHRRTLACGVRWQAAAEIDCAGRVSARPIRSQVDAAAETEMAIVQDLIVSVRNIRAELKIEPKQKLAIEVFADGDIRSLDRAQPWRGGDGWRMWKALPSCESSLAKAAGARSTARFDVRVLYERKIDAAAERDRLSKELTRLTQELTRATAQLSNEAFLAKAPAHVVEGLKKRKGEVEVLVQKANEALGELGA